MPEGRYVISRIGQTLVVTLEGAADAGALSAASNALAEIHARHGADSVVFEVSGCEVIDLDEFVELQKAIRTMEWLGVRCVLELNPRDEPEPQPDPEPEYEPDDAWPL